MIKIPKDIHYDDVVIANNSSPIGIRGTLVQVEVVIKLGDLNKREVLSKLD